MGNWIETNIGKEYDLKTGGTPSKSKPEYYKDGNIPWLVSGDINRIEITECDNYINEKGLNNSNARLLPSDIIMIALNGQGKTKGSVAMLKIEATCNQSLVGIIPKNRNIQFPKFLFYYLKSQYSNIRKLAGGNDRRGLNMGLIRSIKFRFPNSLAEQQRIVAKLDDLFEKIDKAIGLLEENIEHTQALMGSVLDEEFGKLEKFNKPLMSFCKNPKKDMVGGPFGSNLKASEYVDQGYPIIRLQNVDRFNFKEKNIKFVTEEKAEFLSSHSYVSGDIVMTKLGDPLGKCCIVEDVLGINRGVISSDIIRIRIDESKHYKPYVVAGINSEYFIKQLKSKTQGSTRPRVTLKEVRAMQLPMLERKDQLFSAERIDGILRIQLDILEAQTQKVDHLKALKRSLLDQAFNGKL
ncbi:restriction endonuclease subunit S [Psychroflexus sp. CAK8W]|uniref:Restriction endonuclease subunit S n=1 Tax=Psychroflexus longus TaxID=2873596 RepID=A0ABS7XHL7_9FLAO|nr:restriction endonuclease subunit S [Psychroflexus longus]MBZ9778455.1 restriction endonuclease subunit S [Psychroflexus longus]